MTVNGPIIRTYTVPATGSRPAIYSAAEGRLAEREYHLLFNNCEHFATWCKTGKHQSEQVSKAREWAEYLLIGVGLVSAASWVSDYRAALRRPGKPRGAFLVQEGVRGWVTGEKGYSEP